MTNILAIDTATDACSVALRLSGTLRQRRELIPRRHDRRVFAMLDEIVPAGSLRAAGVELLAYNRGPGSFTGLRIAAGAIQGLAYASELPVAGVSTLACMAQGAWRRKLVPREAVALVLLDARVDEVYWGLYRNRRGLAEALREDTVSAPADVAVPRSARVRPDLPLAALGSGLRYLDRLPAALVADLEIRCAGIWPDSVDILDLAQREYGAGRTLAAEQVQPVYLRNEIGWKKVHEQRP